MRKKYPIIEFDPVSSSYTNPGHNIDQRFVLPERCVITFMGDAMASLIEKNECKQIGNLVLESYEIPIFEFRNAKNDKIAVLHGFGGGPYAAGQLEKLIALGCKKYIVCGGCGVLFEKSDLGEVLIPTSAVRDEGTSYHYIKPSREININHQVEMSIVNYLQKKHINYRRVKTWTTDAIYRETKNKIKLRKEEGCDVVEMECASYYAVAQYHNVLLGLVLYAGDDLSGRTWDNRSWKSNTTIRERILELSIDLCGEI